MILVEGISKEDFEAWKSAILTQHILASVRKARDEKGDYMRRGQTLDANSAERTQALTAEAFGYCAALNDVLTMEADEKINPVIS
jgi:hypothetical protein